jgi:transposase InsO family protein
MSIKWRKQIEHNPSLIDLDNWPGFSIKMIEKKKRKKFVKRRNIVAYALQDHTLTKTAKKYNVSVSFVHYLLERTLGSPDLKTPPALTQGLMSNVFLNNDSVKSKLCEHDEVGFRGSFNYLLHHVEGLVDYLDKLLLGHINRKPNAEILKPSNFHKYFLSYLENRNWPDFRYPLNTASKAIESSRKYFHRRMRELKMSKAGPSKMIDTQPIKLKAYQEVEIDAQIMDVETTVYFSFKGRLIPMRVSRISLYLVRDKATGCYLAYHISYTKHPNRYDVLKLLTNIHKQWNPLELTTPGLSYSPGACLPSSLGKIYQSIGIGIFHLDNAMAHHANIVREFITETLNATMNLGLPGNPTSRSIIENAFNVVNGYVHRVQSTTGSHVKDPKKESKKNRKSEPVLTMQALEEFVSVLITHENVTAKEFLGSMTPLEALKYDVQNNPLWIHYDHSYMKKKPFIETKMVNVKCIEHENRSPHINFMRLRFKGGCLDNPELIGKKIVIETDSRDIRQLTAYTQEGQLLGHINCPMSWQEYPISVSIKQHINKLISKKIINGHDPLSGYFDYLLENMHLPKISLELYKLLNHASNQDSEESDNQSETIDSEISTQPEEPNQINIPEWSLDMINDPTNPREH